MDYKLRIENVGEKEVYSLGEDFTGRSRSGDEISFTNYYMLKNGSPFFGISGEFHFSRMWEERWEDELIKMKMGGINVVSTYVFWNHHEEQEGCFDFSGRRDLRKFIGLCQKLGLFVILRVGPFDHGEARNGGLPDWLYGKPFEVRKLNEGFLFHVKRFYTQLGEQTKGLFFREDGPIIGVQIDNEYMHSSAPWEMTAGVSNEWVFGGDEGDAYMLRLKELAAECGLLPAFYTCTGWGGAAVPGNMMPLWGGYAYRPWIFYSHKGEHPSTEEYIYQDFHNDAVVCTNDFKPPYRPQTRPYACCEMGGGMTCCYYYRFRLPYESVDAMANIKLASGCNFLGYYMFQGGSNPVGKYGAFLNEGQVPKISYDYQAALGEFGQIRESYRRLKTLHYFLDSFGEEFCKLRTVLPQGASAIDPKDKETLRYAVRTDGHRGFLFLNNFQDHEKMPDRVGDTVTLQLDGEELSFAIDIAGGENGVLPFHIDLEGIDLVKATAQLVTRITVDGGAVYVFMKPEGMQSDFTFETGASVNGTPEWVYSCGKDVPAECFTVEKGEARVQILVVDRETAGRMYRVSDSLLMFTEAALLQDGKGLRLESLKAETEVSVYPREAGGILKEAKKLSGPEEVLGRYRVAVPEKKIQVQVEQVAPGRYTLEFPGKFLDGLKDVLLQMDYAGDIGHAFLDGRLVHDNFANGAPWEIGLKEFSEELQRGPLTIYITPLKKDAKVNVESAMAARIEKVGGSTALLEGVRALPVYEIVL